MTGLVLYETKKSLSWCVNKNCSNNQMNMTEEAQANDFKNASKCTSS